MKVFEFLAAVRSYGVSITEADLQYGKYRPYGLGSFLELDRTGSGYRRSYGARDIRQMVAWRLLEGVTGINQRIEAAGQRHRAVRLMAAAREGWVVMADGRAWWSLVEPVGTLRTQSAVALPVPQWRH